jgi:hypothetical protein
MKSFQLRLSDDLHDKAVDLSLTRETTVANIIRGSIDIYSLLVEAALQGKRLGWEDPITGEKTSLVIPGLGRKRDRK